jgi:hypothetical protein
MTPLSTDLFKRIQAIYVHRYEPEYARAFADLYWRALLTLACIVVAGAGAYSAVEFFGALPTSDANSIVATTDISGGPSLDLVKLEATLNGFAARQATFKSLQSGAIPPIGDPSM